MCVCTKYTLTHNYKGYSRKGHCQNDESRVDISFPVNSRTMHTN